MRITRDVGNRRRRPDDELEDFGRFSEPALLILISLADGPKHGYAMTEDIASIADVQLGPGTLYGAIARLESRGLIEAIRAEDRRNPYRLTALGEKALKLRLTTLETVARAGRRRLASSEG
jgi:DNA-binding PadR family transcriptional regulator